MVALHKRDVELFVAERANVVLSFPDGELDVVGKGAEVEEALVAGEHVGNDARRALHLAIAHQARHLGVERGEVERARRKVVVEPRPVEAFHDFAELARVEVRNRPVEHVLEIRPEVVGIRVVLVRRHIAHGRLRLSEARFVLRHPFECLFQEVLPDGRAVHVVLAEAIRAAVRFREMALGVAHERAGIDGVVDFLVVERLARDVDGLKPFEFFRSLALAEVHGEAVVEDTLLEVGREVEEALEVHAELARHVVAERKRALLSVHHLVRALGIVAALHPIHHVQRVALHHGVDHRLLLLVVVDKLALIRRPYVEPAAVAAHALLVVVDVAVHDFAHRYIYLLNGHHICWGCLLRIRTRANGF